MSSVFPDRREQYLERSLPSDEGAERCILGGILLVNDLIAQAIEKLKPKDFYSPLNRRVFAAMMTLYQDNRDIDPITVGDVMSKEGSLDAIGGTTTITNLTFGLPYFSDIDEYVTIVHKHSIARQLITVCNMTTSNILAQDEDIESVVDLHEQMIYELRTEQDKKGFEHIGPASQAVMKHQAAILNREVDAGVLSTGFPELDDLTGGLAKTDLIIVAGRPGMGKSGYALTLAQNVAKYEGVIIGIFSLEMSTEQLVKRLLLSESSVNSYAFKRGFLQEGEKQRLTHAIERFQHQGIYIDDSSGMTSMEIRAKARQLKQRHRRLDLIVIDYLQLMSGGSKRSESRQQEVSLISRELKGLAKDLDVPVVALSQLSRAPELRKSAKPLMSDLRESGSIEQDADVVMFVYREAYYKETEENKRLAEIIVGKSRHGPTGTINLAWLPEYTRFEKLQQ